MKQLFLLFIGFNAMTAMAQQQNGLPHNMDSATMHAMELKRLKAADLGLSDIQADSVVNINQELMQQMHTERKKDKALQKKQRKEIEDYKLARLEQALGDDTLAKKVIDYYKKHQGPPRGRHGDGDDMPPPPDDDMDFSS